METRKFRKRPARSATRNVAGGPVTRTRKPVHKAQKPVPKEHGKQSKVRIIPLGGVEEVGRNMTVIEYKNDIVVVDAGLEFPGEATPGIDYIIPNTKYLEARKKNIRGLIISHGHLDHVGAIPYLMDKLGNTTIYTTKITKAMILKRQEEFPHKPKLKIEVITSKDRIKLGNSLGVKFFNITHTIPDAIGTIIQTPLGNVIYPGDFRIELDKKGKPTHTAEYVKLGKENNLVLLLESTNSEQPGFAVSEETARDNLKKAFKEIKGRIIVGTFASQLERIIEIIDSAEKIGRKVVIDGFSMKNNVEMAKKFGLLKPKAHTIIPTEKIGDYPDEKILAICTGAQGEQYAALMRIANGKHKHIKIKDGDSVVLSSSIIPGNEVSIQNLKDNLSRRGANIIHYGIAAIHASGHAYAEELKLMIKMINPKFFIPIHGNYFMLKTNSVLAEQVGIPKENIQVPMNNGVIIEIEKNKICTLKETVPANYVMVDGLGVGDVQEVVLRDRQHLSNDGIFVVIATIDAQTGAVRNSPDIISRGFIYLRESQHLLKETRRLVKTTVEDAIEKMHPINMTYLKDTLREKIGKFLFQKTKRRPMVLLVLIEV